MVRQDGKRNFVLRENGEETSEFSGSAPRQAALKAARRLDPANSEDDARANATEVRLRERGTEKVHVYEAWAWEEEPDSDAPDFLGSVVTQGNVSKVGTEYPNEDDEDEVEVEAEEE